MTSDNEIGEPSTSSSTSTSTTTTTEASRMEISSEELSTVGPTTESSEEESVTVTEMTTTRPEITSEEITENSQEEITENSQEKATENSQEEVTENVQETTEKPQEESSEVPQEEMTDKPQEATEIAIEDTTMESKTEEVMPENIYDLLDRVAATTESMPSTSEDIQTIPPSFWRIGLLGEATSTMRAETPSTMKTNEETTIDPSLNQVLPLTLEEVQSLWSGNFSDSVVIYLSFFRTLFARLLIDSY